MAWSLPNEAATERAGHALASCLRSGDVVGLSGPLGAGKTALVRAAVEGLRARGGLDDREPVTSPTYTLINHYQGPPAMREIVHADLYRLRDVDDLESTGYWDEVHGADLVFIEWIDQVPEAWAADGFALVLTRVGEGRQLEIRGQGQLSAARLRELAQALESVVGETRRPSGGEDLV